MATRYEMIIKKLDNKPASNRRICHSGACACLGCAGVVGSKAITDRELDMYNSGEMQRVVSGQDQ